jgi:hypothetical protein
VGAHFCSACGAYFRSWCGAHFRSSCGAHFRPSCGAPLPLLWTKLFFLILQIDSDDSDYLPDRDDDDAEDEEFDVEINPEVKFINTKFGKRQNF